MVLLQLSVALAPLATMFGVAEIATLGLGEVTVSRADELVVLFAKLLTMTLNCVPLSLATVAGVTYAAATAPAMFTPLRCH